MNGFAHTRCCCWRALYGLLVKGGGQGFPFRARLDARYVANFEMHTYLVNRSKVAARAPLTVESRQLNSTRTQSLDTSAVVKGRIDEVVSTPNRIRCAM
jgi:hypothetical protein